MADTKFIGLPAVVTQATNDIYALSANGTGSYKETRAQMLAYTVANIAVAPYVAGDIIYSDTATTLAKLSAVAPGQVLKSNGVGNAPIYGQVDLTTDVTNILPVANGGTGQTIYTDGELLIGKTDGTLAVGTLTPGTGIAIANADGAITISTTGDQTVTLQDAYNNSITGGITLVNGKPFFLDAIDEITRAPSMTLAQALLLVLPLNGGNGWLNDAGRPFWNRGTPATPDIQQGAYLSDISTLTPDASYGEMYFNGNTTPTINAGLGVPVKIDATYVTGELLNFTHVNGRLTYTGATPIGFKASAVASATMDLTSDTIEISIFKTGALVPSSVMTYDLDGVTPSFKSTPDQGIIPLAQNDYIEVFVANMTSGTNNIVVGSLNCCVTSIGGSNDINDQVVISWNGSISPVGITAGTDMDLTGGVISYIGSGAVATLETAYTSGDGTMTLTASKPFEIKSTSNTIVPTANLRQENIPASSEIIGRYSVWGKNDLGTYLEYSRVQTTVNSPSNGAERSNIDFFGYKNGTFFNWLNYNGTADYFTVNAATTFNKGLLNIGVSNAGANYTLGTSINATTGYTGSYSLMWVSLNGTNNVVANSFAIGDTIELDITGMVNVNIPLPNVDSGSLIRVTFGSVFTATSNSLALVTSTTRTRAWQFKVKITRTNATNVVASGCGFYIDDSYASHPISMVITPAANSYNAAVTTPLTIEYANGNSPGNTYDFIAKNLNIKQYS